MSAYNYDSNTTLQNLITKQNKIEGLNIAWARGKWKEIEPGYFGYVFPEKDAFSIRVNPQTLEKYNIVDDDLYDCISQIETRLGEPKDYRTSIGLFPNSGYSNLGIVVRSRINANVLCVFTPTSIEDGSYDGYFEWYYSPAHGVENLGDFLDYFDRSTDSQTTGIIASPMVPSYEEASHGTRGIMEANQREAFLQKVWNYHKTTSRGFKLRLENELIPIWQSMQKKS